MGGRDGRQDVGGEPAGRHPCWGAQPGNDGAAEERTAEGVVRSMI